MRCPTQSRSLASSASDSCAQATQAVVAAAAEHRSEQRASLTNQGPPPHTYACVIAYRSVDVDASPGQQLQQQRPTPP